MAASLSADQVAAYRRDGYLLPLRAFGPDEAAGYRAMIETLERETAPGSLPRPLNQFFRVNGHVVLPFMAQIALTPAVLDAAESILGPDLLVWSCEFFIKEPGTPKVVTWHQDLTYWGLGETDEELTVWVALSPATRASGCMRFLPGSHHQRILPHRDTFSADNLLSRGQEIAVAVDEDAAVDVALTPGEMSLHHGRMFHASGPNTSSDRRIGAAVRFVTPAVRQIVAERDYAMLARGSDRSGNWIHVAPPTAPFEPGAMALYEQILRDQSSALAAGATGTVGLYAASPPA
jgi:ectoine hydroxylase-related dioxygenase (phytanoyl-CoA dioxygenase family)